MAACDESARRCVPTQPSSRSPPIGEPARSGLAGLALHGECGIYRDAVEGRRAIGVATAGWAIAVGVGCDVAIGNLFDLHGWPDVSVAFVTMALSAAAATRLARAFRSSAFSTLLLALVSVAMVANIVLAAVVIYSSVRGLGGATPDARTRALLPLLVIVVVSARRSLLDVELPRPTRWALTGFITAIALLAGIGVFAADLGLDAHSDEVLARAAFTAMSVLAVATLAARVLPNRSLEIAQVVAVVVAAVGATLLPEHLVFGLFILSLAAVELGVAVGDASDGIAPPTEAGERSSLTST